MTENTELIILNLTKFQENSIIIHTISKDFGRKSFISKQHKKGNKSFFMPLNILEADIIRNPKSKLWTAKNFSLKHHLIDIRNNLYKNSICVFISEVLFKILKEGLIDEEIYNWIYTQIITLNNIDTDFRNFHIIFLLQLCSILGFRPTYDDICPFVNEHKELLHEFINSEFEQAMLIDANGEKRNNLCENILKYIEYHTESTINIKSLKILRELYN